VNFISPSAERYSALLSPDDVRGNEEVVPETVMDSGSGRLIQANSFQRGQQV